jgi:cytidylate kinase
MSCQVVCISRTIAAAGEGVGEAVAQRLGFRYVDEQIIVRAAQLAQVDPTLVAAAEHRQPLLRRLVEKLAAARALVGPAALGVGIASDVSAPAPAGYRAAPEDMRAFVRAAIHEVASAGQAVIVAHAASMALAFVEGVLRVLVTASPETRARRLGAAQGLDAAAASAAVAASDRERREYFRTFYGITDEQPTHYDLVINTDVLTAEQAADVIVAAAARLPA